MPSPLLQDQWSIKFEKCFLCGTSSKEGSYQHESKGLCIFCYKKVSYMKHSKAMPRAEWLKLHKGGYKNYWQKIKNDPEARKRYQEHCRQWRKGSPIFKAYLKRRNKRQRYARFIKDWFENRGKKWQKRHMGLMFTYEHNGIEYKVRTPLREVVGKEVELNIFRKELKKYLDKKAVNGWY